MKKEYELRAHLSQEQFKQIRDELCISQNPSTEARCFVDFSTPIQGIGERSTDIRIRVTNAEPEIVVKNGPFGASIREEAVARIVPADLDQTFEIMALLGFREGVLCARKIMRWVVNDIEIALQQVLDINDPLSVLDQFVEVEYVGEVSDEKLTVELLHKQLAQWKLKSFTLEGWNQYVSEINGKWNGMFIHNRTSTEKIRRLGTL